MKKFDVAVYYRLNTELAGLIVKHAYSFHIDSGHRFQVALDATDPVMSFVNYNPNCLILDLTHQELTNSEFSYYRGKTRYVILGISLKKAELSDFKLLTEKGYFFNCMTLSEEIKNNKDVQTVNPNIFCINGNYYYHIEPDQSVVSLSDISDKETEWLKLWDDFDHYYGYSDDHRVYNRWLNREKEIYGVGKNLGLTKDRMEELYRQVFVN